MSNDILQFTLLVLHRVNRYRQSDHQACVPSTLNTEYKLLLHLAQELIYWPLVVRRQDKTEYGRMKILKECTYHINKSLMFIINQPLTKSASPCVLKQAVHYFKNHC